MTAPLRLDPQHGVVRGVRAAVLTVPAVGVATVAHFVADGCGSAVAVLAAAGLCWPAAVALLGARRRVPALVGWLVAAQVVTHVLLERMCSDVTSGQVSLSAHLQASVTVPMVSAHLGAVMVTALLLGRADAGLWAADALVRAGARALRLTSALPAVVSVPAARPQVVVALEPLRDVWMAVLPARRGPPAPAAL